MRRTICAMLLVITCGCALHREHQVDFSKAMDVEGFEWDGSVRMRSRSAGLFREPGVDRIELGAKDGRSILITQEGEQVHAYIEVKVTTTQPAQVQTLTQGMHPIRVARTD